MITKEDPGADRELLIEAVTLVVTRQFAAASHMQRNLRVGFAKAARLLDMLESWGVVGPAEGSRSRDVLVPVEGLSAVVDELLGRTP